MPNSTLQLGDGDHIAVNTGIITISDFRQKHIARGGEGAPLAAYGDYILFTNRTENRVLLNIGGIANYTFLPSSISLLKAYATDIGPGNTLMNQYMHKHYQQDMDEDAKVAKKGSPNQLLLDELLNHAFLKQDVPKTTGPELFDLNYLLSAQTRSNTETLLPEDVMSTLNKFTAISIAESIQGQIKNLTNTHIYISGGGLHNPLLIDNIKSSLPDVRVSNFHKLGLNPDAKEACLFALLANETVAGKADNITGIKDSPAVCMGKISLPI